MEIFLKKVLFKLKRYYFRAIPKKYSDNVMIKNPAATLIEVCRLISLEKIGAYLRFGDGEINILNGVGAIEQKGNRKIAKEMGRAISLHGEGIMKSLMIHSNRFGREKEMRYGFHLMPDVLAEDILNCCYKYFVGCNIYSHAALSYALIFQRNIALDFFRIIKKRNNLVFVGNENIDLTILKKAFGENCKHVKTPDRNAFEQKDIIENALFEALAEINTYTIVIFAVGPLSNILQTKLFEKKVNVFSFDIGSVIDAFSDMQTRAWMDLADVADDYYKKFLEEI